MPYAYPHLNIKMNGHFGSSGTVVTERWSAGLHIGAPSGMTAGGSTILSFLTAIAPAVSAFHGVTAHGAGTQTFLDTLSGALIATSGRYAGGSAQATTIYTYPAPVAGVGTPYGPWSQAMAWSLRSAILRGPGSHGRCFYPSPALVVAPTTGVLTSTQQANYLAGVLVLINAINVAAAAAFGANTNVSNESKVGLGYQSPVTRVGIGARLDTQESREKSSSEAYVFSNTTIARDVLAQAEKDYLEILKDEFDTDRP